MERKLERNKASRFFVVQEFMTETLNLKGNELLIYAIIYGFSQNEETAYTGSLSYLCSWTKTTKQGVIKNLKSLIKKGLIIKKESYKNNIKYCEYQATLFTPIKQSLPPQSTQFNGGGNLSLPNNINDNIEEKDNTSVLSKEKDILIKKLHNKNDSDTKTVLRPSQDGTNTNTDTDINIYFDKLWNIYPRKVNKQQAKDAFMHKLFAMEQESAREKAKTIYTKLSNQNKMWAAENENKGRAIEFIPYFSTWLNANISDSSHYKRKRGGVK